VPEDLRVLIVEDIASEAELAVRQLMADGIAVIPQIVSSELDFRRALQEFRPDVILSDFTLPDFDGLAALEIAVRIAPDIPFIFFSGTMGEERAIEALKRGAVDYVLKGNQARLVPALKRALREAADRRRHRALEERIRASEQRLREIIDTSQDWIWELDAEGRITFSSESSARILGYPSGSMVGRSFSSLLHADDQESYRRTLASLNPEQPVVNGAMARWQHREGHWRWLEGNLIVLLSADGRVTGYRGAHRDITERKLQQEHIARLTRMLKMQSGINAAVVRIRDRDALLSEACRIATQTGGYDYASVWLLDASGRIARPHFSAGVPLDIPGPKQIEIASSGEPDTCLTSRALRTGEVVVCNDVSQPDTPIAFRDVLIEVGFKSVVVLPLIVDGVRIGSLALSSRNSEMVGDEELSLLQDIQANLSFALQARQKEDAVQFLAYFDSLTGLAKRSLFCERLDDLLRNRFGPGDEPAVTAFDVHQLSHVNDTFGRHVGDLLLQKVADRLRHHAASDKHVGYIGGGTFVLVAPQPTSGETVTGFLEDTVFREPFSIEGRNIRVTCKSGLARYPIDGEDSSTLVQKAEAALKLAKEAGEQYLHYQMEMHSEIAERLALEHKLRIAIDEQQFVLHYQPQVNIATGRIESVEALLRWQDPEQGLVPPSRFLPVLESSGMIVPVGSWVLRRAVEDCRRWRAAGLGPIRIAVNVSAQQIRRRSFAQHVLSVVGQPKDGYGIDLEITETGLLQDIEGTSRKLRQLREAGMRIAIDDFGTGYSSLGLLSTLPVDLLKIDRSFISGLPADSASVTLVSSIIGLASAFNLVTVAEGVETPAQLEMLRSLRCHQSQGYLHSRPVPREQLEAMLQRQIADLENEHDHRNTGS
jgi:PAS domain S-box-containing protein/diguanylate cyclase (GGDEF)-like protein